MSAIKILPQFFTFKKPSEHSPYGPSSLERWHKTACPASIKMSEGIHLPDNKYAEEGTLAHELGEALYNHEAYMEEIPPALIFKIGMFGMRQDINKPEIYSEMLQNLYGYVDCIKEFMSEEKIGKILWHGLEHGMPIIAEKNVFGTGDCVIIGTKAAVVIDLKYGVGKVVTENAIQLQAYAVAIWRHLQNIPEDYKFYSVVYQPRVSFAPKVSVADATRMQQVFNEIWESVDAANTPGILPVEGSHCFWCPAKRTTDPSKKCKAIKDRTETLARGEMSSLVRVLQGKVEVVDVEYERRRDEAARKLLSMKEHIIDTLENLEEEYTTRILSGERFVGLSVEDEFGNRTFIEKDQAKLVELIKAKVPDINPLKVIPASTAVKTITEIEKESKIKDCLVGLTMRRSKKVLKVAEESTIQALSEMLRLTKEPLV